jgi:ABC-2 type transport system permease protein
MSMTKAHAFWELRLTLRNGEQLLLTVIIPVVLLFGLNVTGIFSPSDSLSRIESAFPVVCMVSLIATCFTSLAIGTGFERRSGALTFLATTPLGRQGLVLGKVIATVMLAALSLALVTVVAVILGWRPSLDALWAIPTLLIAGVAFATWALVIASVFRAEAVLAIANALFLLLVVVGGVSSSVTSMPLDALVAVVPSAALSDALRNSLGAGASPQWWTLVILVAWALAGFAIARKRFSWQ